MADIRRYGEDGYGDKPVHMDTVVYWLSHHDPEKFVYGLREIKVYDPSEHTTAKHNVSMETEEIEPET